MAGVVALGLVALWLPSLVPSVPEPASLPAIAVLVVGLAFYGLLALRALHTVLADAEARGSRRLRRPRLAGGRARARADAELPRSRLVAGSRPRGRGRAPRRRPGRSRPLSRVAVPTARRRPSRRRARLGRGDVPRLPGRRARPPARREGRVHRGSHAPRRPARSRRGGGAGAAARAPARARDRRAAPRHRQALCSRRGPAEAGRARRRGVRARPETRRLGRLAPRPAGFLAWGSSARPRPSRAARRQRLPRRRHVRSRSRRGCSPSATSTTHSAPSGSTARRGAHERALGLLRKEAGTAFDARCVAALERVLLRDGADSSVAIAV